MKRFLPYLESMNVIRPLAKKFNITSEMKWRRFSKSNNMPSNIPVCPDKFYRSCGWISWGYWLGTNNVIGCPRRHKINDNYFKKWSHNMAYILGFWFADGNIWKGESYIFSITQHKKDKYILERILGEMDSNYSLIYDNRGCYNFKIVSKVIYDDIIGLGGKERKSLDCKFPVVSKEYLPDFVRGLWDGDGSVFYNKCIKTYQSAYASGSKDFIEQFYKILKENIPDLRGGISKNNGAYILRFSIKDTVLLKRFMYLESMSSKLFLKRKHELFVKAEELHEKHKKEREKLDYNDAQKIIRQKGFIRWEDWWPFSKSDLRPSNISSNPPVYYKNKGWIDWPSWFGNPRKRKLPTKHSKSNSLS